MFELYVIEDTCWIHVSPMTDKLNWRCGFTTPVSYISKTRVYNTHLLYRYIGDAGYLWQLSVDLLEMRVVKHVPNDPWETHLEIMSRMMVSSLETSYILRVFGIVSSGGIYRWILTSDSC